MGETEYKRTAMVPTVDGTTITVKCGDPSWPNMNNDNEPAQVYTVNVKVKSDDKPVTPTNTKVLVRAQDGGAWLHQPMVSELTGGEAGEVRLHRQGGGRFRSGCAGGLPTS